MRGLTYDAGALLAAERNNGRVWDRHSLLLARGIRPTIPAPVLAQAWRGGPQPRLSQFLKGCVVAPLSEADARRAGAACGASGTSDIVDAVVVVGALERGDVCATSDPKDLARIAAALRRHLDVLVV